MYKRKRRSPVLRWGDYKTAYSDSALVRRSDAEIKTEYTRLYDIAKGRIYRLEKEFGKDNMFTSKINNILVRPKDLDMMYAPFVLHDLASFINSKTSKLPGAREVVKQQQETLKSHGFDSSDWKDYNEFMDYGRSVWGSVLFDSIEAATYYSEMPKEYFDTEADFYATFSHYIEIRTRQFLNTSDKQTQKEVRGIIEEIRKRSERELQTKEGYDRYKQRLGRQRRNRKRGRKRE